MRISQFTLLPSNLRNSFPTTSFPRHEDRIKFNTNTFYENDEKNIKKERRREERRKEEDNRKESRSRNASNPAIFKNAPFLRAFSPGKETKLAEYYKILHCLPSCTGNEAKLKQGEIYFNRPVTRERTGIRQMWGKGESGSSYEKEENEDPSRRISWNINISGPMLFLLRL